jgi:hypothetical protein
MFKYGGDVLIITETGLLPLSGVIQSASIDRTQKVSDRIRQFIVSAGNNAAASQGWQVIANPKSPMLLLNMPTTVRQQGVMHAGTAVWSTFSGWNAIYFAYKGGELYFSSSDGAANTWKIRRVTGYSDNGTNITATMLQAYSQMGYGGEKKVEEIRPYFEASGQFMYNMGVATNFNAAREYTQLNVTAGLTADLWGTGLWGTAHWGGSESSISDWQGIPDEYSLWKALYLQTVSRVGSLTYFGSDVLFNRGGNF